MNPYYSEGERTTLCKLYPTAPQEQVLAALPGRHWKSISKQASRLKLRRELGQESTWTAEEEALLREMYPTQGSQAVAQLVGRTTQAVRSRAFRLGVRSAVSLLAGVEYPRSNPVDFTPEERAVVTAHYPTATREQIEALLPGRPWNSIRTLAFRLKVRRQVEVTSPTSWTPEELAILRAEFPRQGSHKVADLLGCSRGRVLLCAKKLKLERLPRERKPKPMPLKAEKPARVAKPKPTPPAKADKQLLVQAQQAARVAPVKRTPAAPTVDVRAEQRRLAAEREAKKPKPYVVAADFAGLGATHPARVAYTREARNGPQAATDAFRAAMQQYNKAA